VAELGAVRHFAPLRGLCARNLSEPVAGPTQTTYTFVGDKLLLELKDDVKKKIGYSPDEMDAGLLTFAYPVLR
jgi:hypothetical protein